MVFNSVPNIFKSKPAFLATFTPKICMFRKVFFLYRFQSPIPVGLIPDIPSNGVRYSWLVSAGIFPGHLTEAGIESKSAVRTSRYFGKKAAICDLTVILLGDVGTIRMRNIQKWWGMFSCCVLISDTQMKSLSFFWN